MQHFVRDWDAYFLRKRHCNMLLIYCLFENILAPSFSLRADLLRCSIQKSFARTLVERDFCTYEAVHQGAASAGDPFDVRDEA